MSKSAKTVRIYKDVSSLLVTNPEEMFHRAVKIGDLKSFEMCLQNKIDPNMVFPDHYTALHLAAEYGNFEIAKRLLLVNDVLVDPVSLHGFTPLMLASQIGNLELMVLLISYNADKYKRDHLGRTALHWTVLSQNIEATLLLLKLGMNPNVVDSKGSTPLNYAATVVCNYGLTKVLLRYNADPFFAVFPHYNVFFELCFITRDEEMESILKLVLTLVNDINVCENFGRRTALHLAALSNYTPVAKILLEHGADRQLKDYKGWTPLKFAKMCKNREVLSLLKSYIPGEYRRQFHRRNTI